MKFNADYPAELHELVESVCLDQLTAEQSDRLNDLLSHSAEARTSMQTTCNSTPVCAGGTATRSRHPPVTQPADGPAILGHLWSEAKSMFGNSSPLLIAATVLVTAVLTYSVALWTGRGAGGDQGRARIAAMPEEAKTFVATPADPARGDVPCNPAAIATLGREVNCLWGPGKLPTTTGSRLGPGTLVLAQGVAQIAFDSGAVVVMKGPATLELQTPKCVFFGDGRMRIHVPKEAIGFNVLTATARHRSWHGVRHLHNKIRRNQRLCPGGHHRGPIGGRQPLAGMRLTAGQSATVRSPDQAPQVLAAVPESSFPRILTPRPPARPANGPQVNAYAQVVRHASHRLLAVRRCTDHRGHHGGRRFRTRPRRHVPRKCDPGGRRAGDRRSLTCTRRRRDVHHDPSLGGILGPSHRGGMLVPVLRPLVPCLRRTLALQQGAA